LPLLSKLSIASECSSAVVIMSLNVIAAYFLHYTSIPENGWSLLGRGGRSTIASKTDKASSTAYAGFLVFLGPRKRPEQHMLSHHGYDLGQGQLRNGVCDRRREYLTYDLKRTNATTSVYCELQVEVNRFLPAVFQLSWSTEPIMLFNRPDLISFLNFPLVANLGYNFKSVF
jgi:hypothetical protein